MSTVLKSHELQYVDGAIVNFRVEVWKPAEGRRAPKSAMVCASTGEKFSSLGKARLFADGVLMGMRCAGVPIEEVSIVETDER